MQTHEVAKIETLDLTHQKRINDVHRFSLLVIGAMCCICTSFSYAFNLISGTMQQQYNLTQRDLTTISSVGLFFMFLALPYAFIFDYFGPIPVAVLATIIYPVGTICLALTFMGKITGSVAKLSVFNAMMGAGCIQFDLISLMATISYFPTRKGYVTVLLKTFTGLGQALVGTIYIGFFNQKADRHFFFLAAFSIVVGILSIFFMRLPPYHLTGFEIKRLPLEEKEKRERTKAQYLAQKPPMWRFIWGFSLILVLTIYLPVQAIVTAFAKVTHTTQIIFAIVAVVLLGIFCGLCLPWTVCFGKSKRKRTNEAGEEEEGSADIDEIEEPEDVDAQVAEIEHGAKGTNEPADEDASGNAPRSRVSTLAKKKPALTELDYIAPQYPNPFLRNLLTTELWALFWSFFVIVGAEFVVIYNAAYILGALMGEPLKPEVRALLTVINGTGSAVGRIIMSVFEIYTQNRKAEDRIPITISLFPPTCSVLIALVLFLVLPGNLSLLLPLALVALGNGFINASIVLTTRTIYAKDSAKHYNFCFLAMAVSALVFVRALYGEWYSRQAEKNGSSVVCYGRNCVQVPLIILICLGATAFATNIYSHLRYRAFNNRTLKARAQMREEAERQEMEAGEPSDEMVVYSAEPIDENKDQKSVRSAK